MRELATILGYLRENKIEFAITGAAAMSVWGVIRASFDVDFVVVLSKRNRDKIMDFAKKEGLAVISDTENQITLRDPETLFDYDFLFTTSKILEAMYRNAKSKRAFGRRIKIVTPEDLILGKLCRLVVSFNHDDARDILALAAVNVLDTDYLCEKLRENFPLQRALKKVVKNADAYRYKDFDLTLGARRLSICL